MLEIRRRPQTSPQPDLHSHSQDAHPPVHLSIRQPNPSPTWPSNLSTYSPFPTSNPNPTHRTGAFPRTSAQPIHPSARPLIPTPTAGAGGGAPKGVLLPFAVGTAHEGDRTAAFGRTRTHESIRRTRTCAKTQIIREGPA